MAASDDGRFVAGGSYSSTVAVRDLRTGTWPHLGRPTAAGLSCLCYDTAKGRALASFYDGSVHEVPAKRVDAVTARWRHVGVVRDWIAKEAPSHEAEMPAFRIGRYPVTDLEYHAFLVVEPDAAAPPSSWRLGGCPAKRANTVEHGPHCPPLPSACTRPAARPRPREGPSFRPPRGRARCRSAPCSRCPRPPARPAWGAGRLPREGLDQ